MSRVDWSQPQPDDESELAATVGAQRRCASFADLEERIDAYLDGDLSPDGAAALLRDIARRPAAFARLSRDQALADALSAATPSPDFTMSVLRQVGAASHAPQAPRSSALRLVRRLSAAAAIVIVASATTMMRPASQSIEPTPSFPFSQLVESAPEQFVPGSGVFEIVNDAVDQVRTMVDERPLVLPAIEYRRGPVEVSPFAPMPHRWLGDPLRGAPREEHFPADVDFSAIGPMDFV